MRKIVAREFIEELQDEVEASAGLDYETGADLFIGNELDIDGDTPIGSLALFEEGATIPLRQRITKQERSIRFLFRDSYPQGALNRAWDFFAWVGNVQAFTTASFRAWVARIDKAPTVTEARRSGTFVSDMVVTFIVMNLTG